MCIYVCLVLSSKLLLNLIPPLVFPPLCSFSFAFSFDRFVLSSVIQFICFSLPQLSPLSLITLTCTHCLYVVLHDLLFFLPSVPKLSFS